MDEVIYVYIHNVIYVYDICDAQHIYIHDVIYIYIYISLIYTANFSYLDMISFGEALLKCVFVKYKHSNIRLRWVGIICMYVYLVVKICKS